VKPEQKSRTQLKALRTQTTKPSKAYFLALQSEQMLLFLFVQYRFLHTSQVDFQIISLPSPFACTYAEFLDGKTIALLWQRGAQAEQLTVGQLPPHLTG